MPRRCRSSWGVARWTYHTVAKEYNGLAKVLESMRKVDCHYLGLAESMGYYRGVMDTLKVGVK